MTPVTGRHVIGDGGVLAIAKGSDVGGDALTLERDAEMWYPVFRINHATTRTPGHDDVSIKHHHSIAQGNRLKRRWIPLGLDP